MGLRSMKKVIESFWVTAGENNVIHNWTKEMTGQFAMVSKTDLALIPIMTYQITSRRHLPSSSSMTTVKEENIF